MGVMPPTVSSWLTDSRRSYDFAVSLYNVMVLVFITCGGAMDDDAVNISHGPILEARDDAQPWSGAGGHSISSAKVQIIIVRVK